MDVQARLPVRVHRRLSAFMALVLHDPTDTDTQGVLARLEPAVNDLYACTPGDIHEALTGALLHVAAEYDLADEMMDLALCSRAKAAGQANDDGDDADDGPEGS